LCGANKKTMKEKLATRLNAFKTVGKQSGGAKFAKLFRSSAGLLAKKRNRGREFTSGRGTLAGKH